MVMSMMVLMPKLILTAAAMRTPENGPRKAANVAPMNRTYLIIVNMKMTVVKMLMKIFLIIKEKIEWFRTHRVICCSKLSPVHQQQPEQQMAMVTSPSNIIIVIPITNNAMIIMTSTKETFRFSVHTRGFGLFGLLVFTRGAVAVPVRHALPKKY